MLRVPGLEEGGMSGGKALGSMVGTLVWILGAGRALCNVPSWSGSAACPCGPEAASLGHHLPWWAPLPPHEGLEHQVSGRRRRACVCPGEGEPPPQGSDGSCSPPPLCMWSDAGGGGVGRGMQAPLVAPLGVGSCGRPPALRGGGGGGPRGLSVVNWASETGQSGCSALVSRSCGCCELGLV